MKFTNFVLFALICLFKNLIKATKFGPMAESLALGDVEFRAEEIHSVNQKDYIGIPKVTKNLKITTNSTTAKNKNKINKRSVASVTNNDFGLGFIGNIYHFSLFVLSIVILF